MDRSRILKVLVAFVACEALLALVAGLMLATSYAVLPHDDVYYSVASTAAHYFFFGLPALLSVPFSFALAFEITRPRPGDRGGDR